MTTPDITDVVLLGRRTEPAEPVPMVVEATGAADLRAYARLRHRVFVEEQLLFEHTDADDVDGDPRTRVLVARDRDGTVLAGVRIHPATEGRDLGWWRGSRLAVAPGARDGRGLGAALVRAACALAETVGALRFDATVQEQNEVLFARLGWRRREAIIVHGRPHVLMDYPITRIQRLANATKAPLGDLLAAVTATPCGGGGAGFVGDDAAPVPTPAGYSGLVAACDAIIPSMVERDPEWAGWCSVLVNLNDLFAMGAKPVGILDAVGARDASFARRVLAGMSAAAEAWGVPVLGGHTQLGVPAALAVTALGRVDAPVPGGGGQVGHALRVTADLGGGWRPGYGGAQWDSSTARTPDELRSLATVVPALAPTAAKDISMSGLVGTTGMLAEASGCGAILDVEEVPVPQGAAPGDWLTCFPGFAVITAETEASTTPVPDFLTSVVCGELVEGAGVGLRWPDGVVTEAVASTVTGMGPA